LNVHQTGAFLTNLAMVLGVAAVTTVLFQRLRQPVVLGYVMAGLITGPHTPVPLFADRDTIETLSELGVILVMFSLGLEFSLRRLLRKGAGVALVAIIEVSAMMWLGFAVARLFGWTTAEALLTAAVVSISSTTIIAKAFEEQGLRGPVRDLVFGVLIFEDLIAIVLLTTLPAVMLGKGANLGTLATTTTRLVAFLAILLVVGMLLVPRFMRFVVRLGRPETTLVASIGLCFAFAVLVRQFGYSVALGAFIAGSLVAESGAAPRVEALVKPIRDMFAAIFFVSVGMLIDPSLVALNWGAVLALTAVVVVGKIVAVTMASFLSGNGVRTSVQAGMSLAQIGEFSFILVAMGANLGVARSFLFPVVVAVSVLTTLLTPHLVRFSGAVATRFHERLPAPIATVAALYGTWIERIRTGRAPLTRGRRMRSLVGFLLLDAFLLGATVIGASLALVPLVVQIEKRFGVTASLARLTVIAGAAALALPFCLGIVRQARKVGLVLAEMALPSAAEGQLDLAAAPRRALIVTLQLAVVLVVGAPLIAVTQPFLRSFEGPLVLLVTLVPLGFGFWRSATNLQGHVRAGAQVIVQVLAAQGHPGDSYHGPGELADVGKTLPGLGTPSSLHIGPDSPAVGRTLAELNLRGLTGATVLAITREDAQGEGESVLVPTGQEALAAGDVLAITGTQAAVDSARRLIEQGPLYLEKT
jgi:CPA2 family monovalent cation:H+ antiporter-2